MKELFRRLALRPLLTCEVLVATLFIAILSLASPMFVIQVLNRYVSYGFSGTLITLTLGMLVAVVLQFTLRIIRTRLASIISRLPDFNLAQRLMMTLTRSRSQPLSKIPKSRLIESVSALQTIRTAYGAASISAVFDAPFSIIFVLAVFYLSPILAWIALGGIFLSLVAAGVALVFSRRIAKPLQNATIAHRGQFLSLVNNPDTVRAFHGEDFIKKSWDDQISMVSRLFLKDAGVKEFNQSLTMSLNILMSVALYAVGAVQVVKGNLSVGALIGANILASRAFSSTTKFVQTAYQISKADNSFQEMKELFRLPTERPGGTALAKYSGRVELNHLFFTFPGVTTPLFEKLQVKLSGGQSLGIVGYNGSGKTTLTRLVMGLIEPGRGEILVDGVSLKQISPKWWRKQVGYLPQEPSFLNGTIREAISMANPDLDKDRLTEIVRLADLRSFLDRSPKGLETLVMGGGEELPVGIRKRVALARALAVDGPLMVFDEPTEGLDEEGCQAVYQVLNQMVKAGKTVIIVTSEPKILKGVDLKLDLGVKPVPTLTRSNNQHSLPGNMGVAKPL